MNEDLDRFEGMTEDEIEELNDSLLDEIGKRITEYELRTAIVNPAKIKQLEFVHEILSILLEGQDVKIAKKVFKPFKSMGSVSVEGAEIKIRYPDIFMKIASFADNIEVYPLVKEAVRMTFTFHGVTKPIE
ncbi:MAG: hypothetical protein GX897_00175 [Clostridiales bacterium]|nr:hypothetical protein [Clostridiales bacterium]